MSIAIEFQLMERFVGLFTSQSYLPQYTIAIALAIMMVST